MRKNLFATAALTAALAVIGATCAFAQGVDKVDVQGIKFEVPEDLRDIVTVNTEGLDENTLVEAYETGSVEAAKAMNSNDDGAGWLFTITCVSEDEMKDLRCQMTEGMDIFAEDEDIYYVFNQPTDVRYVREDSEKMEADQETWSKATEWAYGSVRSDILAGNPELEAKNYSYTALDSYLCRIAYKDDLPYEIRTLQYPDLDASTYTGKEYVEELTEDVTYEYIDEPEDTAGEYIVLAFPELDVRYDFLTNPGNENTIREVHLNDDEEEEFTNFYQATFEDPEDTAIGIMQEWVDAIANGESDDDDAEDD